MEKKSQVTGLYCKFLSCQETAMSYGLIFLPTRLIQATQTLQNDKYHGLNAE